MESKTLIFLIIFQIFLIKYKCCEYYLYQFAKPVLHYMNIFMQKDGNEDQKYHLDANNHVSSLTSVKPETKKLLSTNAELTELSEKIFAKENHSKLKNLHLDLQGKTEKYSKKDEAARPLFHPDDQALRSNSISKLLQLYDNYEPDTRIDEHFTPIESREENEFLDIVMVSGVMKEAMGFLHAKGKFN